MALRRGEAHIAPIHLLDEEIGTYNLAFVKRYLNNMEMSIIKGVKRVQGFIVRKGNPKGIKSFEDLLRQDVQFVNRQKGAGTRLLVDYKLKCEGIDTAKITGYDREMTTHMAVAAAVASGSADVGVGVMSAAKAMEMDFIPIGEEDYDFAVPTEQLNTTMLQIFLEVLKSQDFKAALEALGGYSLEGAGEIISI